MVTNDMTTKVQYPNPLKIGAIRENAWSGPKPEYCPIISSRRKIGIPIRNNIIKYVTRKAPKNKINHNVINYYSKLLCT